MGNSLIDVGKLSKPVTVLIEKISNATGILYEPTRIRREAKAKADASKTKLIADLDNEDIKNRALMRILNEEIKNQKNIESITEKSFEHINENSKPNDIEDDWLSNFFDKSKLISDSEMQTLWAKVLAGESNNPGNISKRTIEFLSTMDKKDALLFEKVLLFSFNFLGYTALIFPNGMSSFETTYDLTFNNLQHLDTIGLINYEHNGYVIPEYDRTKNEFSRFEFKGRFFDVNFYNKMNKQKDINVGSVKYTALGIELVNVIQNIEHYDDKIYHYIIENLYKQGILLSEPLENNKYPTTVYDGYQS